MVIRKAVNLIFSDLTIGRGNVLTGNHTYRNEWDSLTVIGNNNDIDGAAAGIIIGDNQKGSNILDSIIIGSLSPEEKKTIGVGNRKWLLLVTMHWEPMALQQSGIEFRA